MPPHHDTDVYYEAVRSRYQQYQEKAQRRKDAGEGTFWPVIRYYTPAGGIIRVSHVVRDAGSDVLDIQGTDEVGNPCDVMTTTVSAQIVLSLITEPTAPERRPVGFG